MRGLHDLLREKPSLFMLLGWSAISIASLLMYSICPTGYSDPTLYHARPQLISLDDKA